MFTDRIDKGISDWSARAFKAAAIAELGLPSERAGDIAQRELLVAVAEGYGSQQSVDRLKEASDSGLVDLSSADPQLTPLGDYLLSLETSEVEIQPGSSERELAPS